MDATWAWTWAWLRVATHVRGDVGLDLPQDVLAVHELDPDGHHMGL